MKPLVSQNIFRSYDIRGIYPTEINEDIAKIIGSAYVDLVRPKSIVLGRDMRNGSESLSESFARRVLELGVNIDDIGLVPVDALYYAVGKNHYDGGVYCTASHNPKEYHGFKMVKGNLDAIRGTDIKSVIGRNAMLSNVGRIRHLNILKEFAEYLLSFIDVRRIKPLHVVVDAGNGMAGTFLPLLQKRLPVKITPLFFELDGNFPNHPSDPFANGSLDAVTKEVLIKKADCGVIFDGDTDRVFFIDEKGNFIRADITLCILSKLFLKRVPHATIVYNAICSKAVPELVTRWGGKAVRCKVGSVNVRDAVKKNNGILGGELSGHYIFKDNFYSDSGHIAFLIMLELLSCDGRKMSDIVKEAMLYEKSNEINIRVENIEKIIHAIKKRYSDGKQDFLDGITVHYDTFWFNVRPSNTEPLLRITLEAKTKKLLEQKKNELLGFIDSVK